MKVTITIPFYNDGKYFAQAIRSVLNQTYQNFELILIDDGSTDNSLKIAQEFASKDNRIIVVSDGENYGLAVRLNQSIRMAKCDYYARMDADDIMCVDRIKTQVEYLDSHQEVDVVGSSAMLINDKNEIVGSRDLYENTKGFMHPTIMGRTRWFLANPYAEWCRRCQDSELWLRTGSHSVFRNLRQPLLFYREAGTVSFKKYMKSRHASMAIARKYKDYNLNFFWYIKRMLRNYIQIITYYIFDKLGMIDFIVMRRKATPLADNYCLQKEDLQKSIT